ncbi:hypothetical protein [uncultured Cellulomonas sp.]|uniref:hypothetical protein n=1 Tax=uncultured Cellulomonas sp. TaxID=189682 RepID=UPI0026282CFD|nr:hypothetical protein [uncultured Cellulomonas sp.]
MRAGTVPVPRAPVAPGATRHSPDGGDSPRAALLTRTVAVATVGLTGLRVPLPQGVVPGLVVAVLLAPVWLPALRHYRGARLLVALSVAAVLNGWWLHEWSAADHRVVLGLATGNTMLLAGIVGGAGVLLWARLHLSDAWVGVWLAAGLAGGELFQRGQWGTNPWKFAFVVPVALLVLSLARMTRQRVVEMGMLLALGVVSILQDSRSAFAIFALTATLILWQIVPVPVSTRRHSVLRDVRVMVLLALVAGAVYNAGTALLLEGSLGSAAQQRSEQQIQQSGSLLLGGRPELAATAALMRARPEGFGPGTIATPTDVVVAKTGMESIGYDTGNGYVERFLFGSQIRLHSVTGELWAYFGIAGLVLAVAVLVVLVAALASALSVRAASGVVLWLTCLTAWNAFFGPLYGSAAALLTTLGLVLVRRDTDAAARLTAGSGVRTP